MTGDPDTDWSIESADKSATLWRYMGITQCLSLLSRKSLRFTFARSQTDPHEGIYPEENLDTVMEDRLADGHRRSKVKREFNALQKYAGNYLINCWTQKNHQSAALWSMYTENNEGVAVKSSVGALRRALQHSDHEFAMGRVEYQNYDEPIPVGEYSVIFHKRHSFNYEDEFRVVAEDTVQRDEPGEYVECDLEELIDRVYVHPQAAGWFSNLVERVTNKDYKVGVSVEQSSLFDDPIE